MVGQFHDVIKEPARVVAAHLENIDEARVRTADRLESHHSIEFTAERAFAVEILPPDEFDRSPGTGRLGASEPDFAVGTPADPPQHLVVGHLRARFRIAARRARQWNVAVGRLNGSAWKW